MVFASSIGDLPRLPQYILREVLFLANHRHGAVFKDLDTALRVFSFVGLGMGGKFMGEGVSRFKTEWGQKDCAGRSPQKTKHLQRLIPKATELSSSTRKTL